MSSSNTIFVNVKCVVIGDGAVGKSCFLKTAVTGSFPADYVPRAYSDKVSTVELSDGRNAALCFWDSGE